VNQDKEVTLERSWLYLNAANIVTALRIPLLPVSLTLLFVVGAKEVGFYWAGIGVMVTWMLLDWADGVVARFLKIVSAFGKWFDQYIDKCCVWPHMAAITLVYGPPMIQLWIVLMGTLLYADYLSNEMHTEDYERYKRDRVDDPSTGAISYGKIKFFLMNALMCVCVAATIPVIAEPMGEWENLSNSVQVIGFHLAKGGCYLLLIASNIFAWTSVFLRKRKRLARLMDHSDLVSSV